MSRKSFIKKKRFQLFEQSTKVENCWSYRLRQLENGQQTDSVAYMNDC